MTELLITYPAGSTAESSTVVAVGGMGPHVLFAVERTPCHPESPRWPDQPADRCTLTGPSEQAPVECLEGYLRGAELGLGEPPDGLRAPGGPAESLLAPEDPAEGGHPPDGKSQAIRCVVHRAPGNLAIEPGEEVTLSVDERYRESVSRSHSRCHLASLALNAALADAWRKEPPARDSLGNPDFDKLAILTSRIDEHGSVDVYRVGKHVRKAGFSADALSEPEALAQEVARIAGRWLQSTPAIAVTPGICRLEERRTWSCELPEGTASFPCGGTHVRRMEPNEGLAVAISWDPQERRLQMTARSDIFEGQSVYD
jgi:alanyl-tRNA synthetase